MGCGSRRSTARKPYELKAGRHRGLFVGRAAVHDQRADREGPGYKYRKTRSTEIAERLLEELGRLDDPDQDNISFTVIKINDASVRPKQDRPIAPSMAVHPTKTPDDWLHPRHR